ncbi:hypothetical protein [Halobacillus karajensis]|uniref:Uncharacterized protein n=1 Tax=Halobacillus karajensis TaxID=195088 RepID=A0A024P585_9BACI|nr:hypothetical protein [Halobacillus karajensis]CDQ20719.1 hypothetical protein BN982_03074 [Halobacillus karajensis]CDQ23811.1 hypothetical protein BN983_02062 [Halobacillus karajensis]CDQ27289.1 hypothetical protein BN981_01543 [Halobacillus karajensis]
MAEKKDKQDKRDGFSPEQKLKEKDPNRDIEPQREVENTNKKESEKSPDDYE